MSEVWDIYADRASVRGFSKRDAVIKREIRAIQNILPDNPSYQTAEIYLPEHGYNISDEYAEIRRLAIISSANKDEKTVISMPGEEIRAGSLMKWMDSFWLITERDADTTLYTKTKAVQCNHLLRWVSSDNEVIEQWCVIEDGTKYLTAEFEDRNFVVTRGDSRIYMTIAKTAESVRLDRTNRFLIDDENSPIQLAYTLSKPLKLGGTYNGEGVFKFILQEVQSTEDDNLELHIADYYKHFPKHPPAGGVTDEPPASDEGDGGGGKKVWL